MKKLMVTVVATAMAVAGVKAATVTYTPEEYEAKCDAVYEMAQTNLVLAQKLFDTNGLSTLVSRKDLAAQAKAVDTKLSGVGIRSRWYYATRTNCVFQKMGKNGFDRYGAETKCPVRVATARKYNICASSYSLSKRVKTMDEMVPVLSEMCKPLSFFNTPGEMKTIKKALQQMGENVVKKYLRAQGKSFVTKDGVNPCATYMEALNAALNAPYFNGLNAWLEQMGCTARVDVSKLLTPAEADKLKADILNADVNMNKSHQYMLQLCLGVEGYNAFVKDYNGEE